MGATAEIVSNAGREEDKETLFPDRTEAELFLTVTVIIAVEALSATTLDGDALTEVYEAEGVVTVGVETAVNVTTADASVMPSADDVNVEEPAVLDFTLNVACPDEFVV